MTLPPSLQYLNTHVRSITFDSSLTGSPLLHILNRRESRSLARIFRQEARTFTMYKRKDRKILPANVPLPDGVNPTNVPSDLKPIYSLDQLPLLHEPIVGPWKGKIVPRGSRLTPERLSKMKIGTGYLREAERKLFVDILYEFEAAVAFDESEMGLLDPSIEPPVVIPTIPHTPWQQQNIRLPKAMQDAATAHVTDKLQQGILEFSQGPYRSRYFLVAKKTPGAWRFINDVQPLNKVTIRDSGMPPAVDEFSEDFAGYPITSAIDYYSGYYQISLDKLSRDLTSFLTALGLVRMTRLPQGWTNSVSIFQRIISKIHWRLIPHFLRPFIDDIGLKGPKERYGEEEILPGIRRFVYQHAQLFRQFMYDTWNAGLTISGEKSAIGMRGVEIVGFLCDEDGRRPEPRKVQRILDWPTPRSVRDARAFIGLAVYYRIFVFGFSVIAAPIFSLFRQGKRFEWSPECESAMVQLKTAISNAPVLVSLDLSPSGGPIVLYVDASTTIGWGAVLSQVYDDEKEHPARFESGIWSNAELKYDAIKLECRGLLKALKKMRFWLFGRFFTVRTDSQVLVWLLNQPPNDLPNAMMTRWLAYIRLFDFDVKHVPGNRNGAADGLSRRGLAPEDESDSDPDDYFEAKLYGITATRAEPSDLLARIYLNHSEYTGDDLRICQYLETLERPEGISTAEYQALRQKSKGFLIRDGHLFKRSRKRGQPPRRVVSLPDQRSEIVQQVHDEIGHRGVNSTFERVSRRYQWKGMFEDVASYVKSCPECQRRKRNQLQEPLHPTFTSYVWEKIGVDVVYMPPTGNYKFIVFARDDLSGWVEGRAIDSANSANVSKFLLEDVICRHGCPRNIVMDGGTENLDLTQELLTRYKIRNLRISAYHPQSNGLVERGHGPIVNSLAKFKDRPGTWVDHLHLALWADRVSVRRSTGYTAFELLYGRDCILPVELSIASWSMVDWDDIRTREDLILARMRQLEARNQEISQAAENLRNARKANKDYFDSHKVLRNDRLRVGDLVLLFRDILPKRARNYKLDDRWSGPYRIREAPADSTYYHLEELDGTPLRSPIAGNRLRKFYARDVLSRDREIADFYRQAQDPPIPPPGPPIATIADPLQRAPMPPPPSENAGMIDGIRSNDPSAE